MNYFVNKAGARHPLVSKADLQEAFEMEDEGLGEVVEPETASSTPAPQESIPAYNPNPTPTPKPKPEIVKTAPAPDMGTEARDMALAGFKYAGDMEKAKNPKLAIPEKATLEQKQLIQSIRLMNTLKGDSYENMTVQFPNGKELKLSEVDPNYLGVQGQRTRNDLKGFSMRETKYKSPSKSDMIAPDVVSNSSTIAKVFGVLDAMASAPGRTARAAYAAIATSGRPLSRTTWRQELATRSIDRTAADQIFDNIISVLPVANLGLKASTGVYKAAGAVIEAKTAAGVAGRGTGAVGKFLEGAHSVGRSLQDKSNMTVKEVLERAAKQTKPSVSGIAVEPTLGAKAGAFIKETAGMAGQGIKEAGLGTGGQAALNQAGLAWTSPDTPKDDRLQAGVAIVVLNALAGGAMGAGMKALDTYNWRGGGNVKGVLSDIRGASDFQRQVNVDVATTSEKVLKTIQAEMKRVGMTKDELLASIEVDPKLYPEIREAALKEAGVTAETRAVTLKAMEKGKPVYTPVEMLPEETAYFSGPFQKKMKEALGGAKVPAELKDAIDKTIELAAIRAPKAEIDAQMNIVRELGAKAGVALDLPTTKVTTVPARAPTAMESLEGKTPRATTETTLISGAKEANLLRQNEIKKADKALSTRTGDIDISPIGAGPYSWGKVSDSDRIFGAMSDAPATAKAAAREVMRNKPTMTPEEFYNAALAEMKKTHGAENITDDEIAAIKYGAEVLSSNYPSQQAGGFKKPFVTARESKSQLAALNNEKKLGQAGLTLSDEEAGALRAEKTYRQIEKIGSSEQYAGAKTAAAIAPLDASYTQLVNDKETLSRLLGKESSDQTRLGVARAQETEKAKIVGELTNAPRFRTALRELLDLEKRTIGEGEQGFLAPIAAQGAEWKSGPLHETIDAGAEKQVKAISKSRIPLVERLKAVAGWVFSPSKGKTSMLAGQTAIRGAEVSTGRRDAVSDATKEKMLGWMDETVKAVPFDVAQTQGYVTVNPDVENVNQEVADKIKDMALKLSILSGEDFHATIGSSTGGKHKGKGHPEGRALDWTPDDSLKRKFVADNLPELQKMAAEGGMWIQFEVKTPQDSIKLGSKNVTVNKDASGTHLHLEKRQIKPISPI